MEKNELSVMIPVAGKVAHVPLVPTGTDWDRLSIAWCILAVPAMNEGEKTIVKPDAYLQKTMSRLSSDPDQLRPKANAWAAGVRAKTNGKIALHAMLRMLLGNQVQAGLLWVDFPEGAVDAEVRKTAQLLLGHPVEHTSEFCAACKAIRRSDWPLAIRIAGHRDAPIILGALVELYRGALQAGLVPMVYASPDGMEHRGDETPKTPNYREEDLF